MLCKNIFTENISIHNLNINKVEFYGNRFEDDFRFRNNTLSNINFSFNKFYQRFHFEKNNIQNNIGFWYCIFNYSDFYENKYNGTIYFEVCKFLDTFRMFNEIYKKRLLFTDINAEASVRLADSEFNEDILFSDGVYKCGIDMSKLKFNGQVIFDNTIIDKFLFIDSVQIRDEFHLQTVKSQILLTMVDCQIDSVLHLDNEKILGVNLIRVINNGRIQVKNLDDKGKTLIEKCINIHQDELDKLRDELRFRKSEYTDIQIKYKYKRLKIINQQIKETLLLFRDNFKNISREEIEDNFYYEYKRFDIRPYYHNIYRKKYNTGKIENIKGFIENCKKNKFFYMYKGKKSDFIKFINQYIFEVVGGFGTKPKSIFYAIFTIIFIFGLIYYNFGIDAFIGPQEYNIMVDIGGSETIDLKFYGDELDSYIKSPLVAAMYFSFITFLGNINAWNEGIALVAAIEGILGVGLIAYLSFAIIRKIIR